MKQQPGAQERYDEARSQRRSARGQPGPPTTQTMLPSPSMPMQVARRFVEASCVHDGKPDELTLRYWCASWWGWRTTHWIELAPHAVRQMLYAFTEHAVYLNDKMERKQWSPNRYKVGDVLEALSAIVLLRDDFEQPGWLDGRESGPIVAVSNGLLDITSRQLQPHSPLYFTQVSVPFPYDPDVPEPECWNDFLDALWPDEPDAIDVLGEWFGYVISGRTDLHKIFMMVGPTRGGKGVIARILGALLGKRNVCGPTLSSLGSEFGLAPLLGKSLAVISDARSSGIKGSSSVVVERLLSISGEDTLTVNRKYKEQWSGKLPVRLHIVSNELPRLGDASSAIIGRLVLLLTTRSWLGKEDHELEAKLRKELTGILNFALEGLRRLTVDNENHFTRFACADEAITQMRDLASPVGAFVRERCTLEPDAEIAVDALYSAYKDWCQAGEYPKSPKVHFGRDLRAACPSVRKTRPRDSDSRHYVYAGIRLRADGDDDIEADTGDDIPLFTRTTRTKAPTQPPRGPSGLTKKPNVEPSSNSSSRVAREREMPSYGKSDDLPYRGPIVPAPDPGPDPLDEHGAPQAASPHSSNGEPGLSRRRVQELADWYQDEGHRRHNNGTLDTAELDAELRAILREEVAFPEHIEIEFARVMRVVFAV